MIQELSPRLKCRWDSAFCLLSFPQLASAWLLGARTTVLRDSPAEVCVMVTEARPPLGNTTERVNRFSVLIADDDRGNREALGEVLEQRGFRTLLAEDGGRAVELVQVDLVHLVL